MAKLLIIHTDKQCLSVLESYAQLKHQVATAKNLMAGLKQMAKNKPELIMVGHDSEKKQGIQLLRYLRENALSVPVVVVVDKGSQADRSTLTKLGNRGFIEYPFDRRELEETISTAVTARRISFALAPPITEEESNSNLSMLENKLNQGMKCTTGKNQVYIQSMILGGGTSKPRICLKCSLRAEYGLNREVYFEFIRDICCRKPSRCEAIQQFNEELAKT